MINKAIENLKGRISIEREYSKADIHYIRKLRESLKDDLVYAIGNFHDEREVLSKNVERAAKMNISDKFLLTKSKELLDESLKLSKKLVKYRGSSKISCIKFRDMYNSYLLISETNRATSLMRNYTTQLTKYINNE